MKTLLGCLMCSVLTMSQAFAISGGPFGGGGGRVGVTGTYSGVFVPVVDPTIGLADNSLALFTLSVPRTGTALGTTAIFRNGFFYSGTIQASADPQSDKVSGIIQGSFTDTIDSSIFGSVQHNYFASGQFQNTKIGASATTFGTSSVRLKGTADIEYIPGAGFTPDPRGDSGGPITYKVHGFKQSNVSS